MTNDKKNSSGSFTNNEVGVLIESFRNDISVIAEDLTSVRSDVSVLKTDMIEVKSKLGTIEDAVRIAIPSLNRRVSALEAKAGI